MTELYALRANPNEPGEYRITKFDEDLNVASSRDKFGVLHQSIYNVSKSGCDCPRGHKHSCRHREMLAAFLADGHVNDGWMLDYHTRLWWEPVKDVEEIISPQEPLSDPEPAGPPPEKSPLPSGGGGGWRRF